MKDDCEARESEARESSEFLIAHRQYDEEKNRRPLELHPLRNDSPKRRWLKYGLIAITPLLVLVGVFALFTKLAPRLDTGSDSGLSPIYNKTLGFEKIFVINMPGRTDKRDAITLAASYSGMHLDFVDGVSFDEIPSNAIPQAMTDLDWLPSVQASWRAHLNVLAKIVHEEVHTALIMEDDSDWDVNLKPQLDIFAQGATELQRRLRGDSERASSCYDSENVSCYGDDWDTLWLGHCRAAPSIDRQDVYVITNDSTVPPVGKRHGLWQQLHVPPEAFANDTRIVFHAFSAGCTMGYAVTWEAARKVLTSLSLEGDGNIYDVALSLMCRGEHITPYECYSVYPPLLSSHRFAGSNDRDSDILGDTRKSHEHGDFTFDIVYSVIENFHRIMTGAKDVMNQWQGYAHPAQQLDEKYIDRVVGSIQTMDLTRVPVIRQKGMNMRGNEEPDFDPATGDLVNHPDGPYKEKEDPA